AVGVTASTGIAALAIDGHTLHSFGGIGTGEGTKDELYRMMDNDIQTKARWLVLKVLIIDES
ncbi:hypothetical protein CALVIDRAFT_467868, partial [Calocera viscosa TUFC12733]